MSSVYAQDTKIHQVTTPTKNNLTNTMTQTKKSEKIDKETISILEYMSNLDNKEIKSVLKKYGYNASIIDTLLQEEKDPVLYQTMLEMNKKYGNPKITPKRSGILNEKKYKGLYSPIGNKTRINASIYNNRHEMVYIWLGELCHAKQFHEKFMLPNMLKDFIIL